MKFLKARDVIAICDGLTYAFYNVTPEHANNHFTNSIFNIRVQPYLKPLYQELYSEGVIGLTEAVQRYKPGKAQFATYTYFRIKGAILDYMQANKSLIKIPWTANRSEQQLSVVSLSASDIDDCSDFKQTDVCIEEEGYSLKKSEV